MEIIKSKVVKWRWAYDGEPWHYAYTVLAKKGNDYIVIDKFMLAMARAWEFAYDERLRAMLYYSNKANAIATHKQNNIIIGEADGETILTDRLVSLGYCEEDNYFHPRYDEKPIIQVYLDEDYQDYRIGRNSAITIEPFKFVAEKEKPEVEKKVEYHEYEQIKLFI